MLLYAMKAPLIVDDIYEIIIKNVARLDSEIIYDRDFDYDYFGFKTLERSYILKVQGKVVERPQHMLMRVVVGIHKDDIDSAVRTYHMMSQRWFTHASPTLFNTEHLGLSCFLVCMKDYSIEGIYDTLKECVVISKSAGGIGVSIHNIHATGSYICATTGTSNGIVPMLRVFNDTARYVDQGGGKRKGRATCSRFFSMLFGCLISLWKEFRAMGNGLCFAPMKCQRSKFGLYMLACFACFEYAFCLLLPCFSKKIHVHMGKSKEGCSGTESLWFEILKSQIETGTPYMFFKKLVQLGINCSAAICKREGVTMESHPTKLVGSRGSKNRYFDFDKLEEVTAMVTTNLNKIIDVNYYPVDTAFVELLFDLQFKLDAQQLNKDIFQTIYYHALKTSSELAAKEGPYETFSGSPISKGILQPDMLGVMASSRWDRGALWKMISKTGVRNSLLVAPMPTASTCQILGNNDGEFVVVNKHLLHDLTEMGLWSPTIKNNIISEDGSVQKIPEIPDDLKIIYKTVWEIKQKTLVDMAVDRGCYID
ncbi:Ribonucleoside-diphosphate reductase large subunit [Glycine soja]